MEIGSNDGYLLQHFARAGIPTLGIDPAKAACQLAAERGIGTRQEFFSEAVAERLAGEGISPRVIVANNVMAHVPDLNDVTAGVRRLLAPDGVFVIETPYLRDLIERLEFDTIYHEHLFYYSLTSLSALLERHGLGQIDVTRVPIHGGSLRVTAGVGSGGSSAADRLLPREAEWGVREPETYSEFSSRVDEQRRGDPRASPCPQGRRPAARCVRRRGEGGDAPQRTRDRHARCSTSSWTGTRRSRAGACPARGSRSARPRICSRRCRTTSCCWPGTWVTR